MLFVSVLFYKKLHLSFVTDQPVCSLYTVYFSSFIWSEHSFSEHQLFCFKICLHEVILKFCDLGKEHATLHLQHAKINCQNDFYSG